MLAICFPALRGELRSSNMSVSDFDGDATGYGEAGGSVIVAYEATRRKSECSCIPNVFCKMRQS